MYSKYYDHQTFNSLQDQQDLIAVWITRDSIPFSKVEPQQPLRIFQKAPLPTVQEELQAAGELGSQTIKGIVGGLRDSHVYASSGTPTQ